MNILSFKKKQKPEREGNLSQLSKLALTFPSQADLRFFFEQGNFTDLRKHVLNKDDTSTVL